MDKQPKELANEEIVEWMDNFSQFTGKSQSLLKKIFEKRIPSSTLFQMIYFNQIYQKFLQHIMSKPDKLMDAQLLYWQELFFIWQRYLLNSREVTVDNTQSKDKRFQDPAWHEQPAFHFIKEFYLLHVRQMKEILENSTELDKKTFKQIQFYLKQLADALSPTNFVMTNPEVWRTTLETKGKNLLQGLNNALNDLSQNDESFQIKMTDFSAFGVGKNLAITPGKVIYQNDIMQLIQYDPQTENVFQRPLLIIPPWINKYYILDLDPELSLVNWLVQQGYTVFMISWINANKQHAQKDFVDYLLDGFFKALAIIEKTTRVQEVNTLGYCVGGTLLACALAYAAYCGDKQICSATYLCSLLDFSEPGDLGALVDENQVGWFEKEMQRKGYHDGNQMAMTFNLLRPNDLIWSYYVKNYLLGENPYPHAMLYWNGDSTNIPEKMHRFYLRNMYLENCLVQQNKIILNGVPIDLNRIQTPVFFVSTLQDHIAPWKSVYAGVKLHSGPADFVLTGSGHIAGAINPPTRNKYNYYVNPDLSSDSGTWFKNAKEQPGSWWPHWEKWLRIHSGKKVKSRVPGENGLTVIEEAPGSYVRVQLQNIRNREKEVVD